MENEDASLWELIEFCAREAMLLRSFLEYLRSWPDSPEKKAERLQNWRNEIGLQMGDPKVNDPTAELFQKLRDAPREVRIEVLRTALGAAYFEYFGQPLE